MRITIITATYNSARTVETALKSVLMQTYKDVEHIIVDGASKDGTMDIIRHYEELYGGRLKYVSEPDKGIYDAMNKGIAMATGDVVGILNSDDYFTSDEVLERVVKGIAGVDAVYGDIHFINDGHPDKCVRYYSSRLFRPAFFRFGFMPAHPSFYVRREVYEQYGVFSLDYKIAADFDLLVRFMYVHKIRTRYLPMDFVTMRTGGISTQNVSNRLLITKEVVKVCNRNGIYTNSLMVCVKYLWKIFEFKK